MGINFCCVSALVRRFCLAQTLPVLLFLTTHYAQAATITVNTTGDSLGETLCSLRSAIRAGNTNSAVGGCRTGEAGLDTIVLPAGLYALTSAGPNENAAQTGDLDIHEDLVINGADRATTIIDGAKLDRIFEIAAGATVTLTNLALQNGRAGPAGDPAQLAAAGGAIYNAGWLTLRATNILSNSAPYSATAPSRGGAIYSTGPLTLAETLFQGNQAQVGGALYAIAEQVVITGSRFIANQAETGGALYLDEQSVTTISQSQILSNTASAEHTVGGGLANAGVLTMTAVRVAHNEAFPRGQIANAYSQGGGIANLARATLTITHSTIDDNHVSDADFPESQGGGVYNAGFLYVQQTGVRENSASGEGGGIFGGGTYRDVTIEQNSAGYSGGGLYGLGNLTNVTISHNTVGEFGHGGGGYGCGTLVNVTISHNHADNFGRGGALSFDDRREGIALIGNCLTLDHATIISNSATSGAGLLLVTSGFAGLRMGNSVIAHNEGSSNCNLSEATGQSFGGNYVDDQSCQVTAPTDRQGDLPEPQLGPLADNGGLALTHLPQAGSPLIDSGNCDSSTLADQRGAARPQGYGCDVGAVEAPGPFLRFLPNVSK